MSTGHIDESYSGSSAIKARIRWAGELNTEESALIAEMEYGSTGDCTVALFCSSAGKRLHFLAFRTRGAPDHIVPVSKPRAARWLIENFGADHLSDGWIKQLRWRS
ncbi:hypothetical protein HOY34_21340 [Xinfangfangia sp. D13-10-4-6]|uniref:hypothetical protein n=1 Tax=Pseudogemmobacter hezensis TaxID=2737662 RepID=UPI001553DD73|nr:hypothetical protein [Pseudogemmobacter hezensis]NPD17727.1 hypothetical protein [Pseudogemmobacter hezensis]